MRIVWRLLKWIAKLLGLLIVLVIIAGVLIRLFGPKPHEPVGELIDIGDFKLHITTSGIKSDKPTIVIEGGNGMATEYYYWLSEGLKDSIRVVRYDRAGIGYSEFSKTPRDPETIAHELHNLLEKSGESPPYIMVGHSLGGPYVRVFTELYPNDVMAMFLLDTTHPDRVEKITSIPNESSWKWKLIIWGQKAQTVLADMGILMLYDMIAGPTLGREMEGLPAEINNRTRDFLINGKYLRATTEELAYYHKTLERTGRFTDFGTLPIKVITSAEDREIPEEVYQKYLEKGIDLRKNQILNKEMQEDFLNLSTNSKLIEIDGNHTSIFTKKENADIISEEILSLVDELQNSALEPL